MEERKLEIADVMRLHTIFKNKKWFAYHEQDTVYENFCELLANLTPSQKELIFELCERYLWLSMSDYLSLLLEILEGIENEKILNCKRIIVFPIIKPEDNGKVKSSSILLYCFKSVNFGVKKYAEITFEIVDSYENFIGINFTENDLIFLVDDYIGSGETVEATILEIAKNESVIVENTFVIALVGQNEILDKLRLKNYTCYVKHEMKKGITDYYVDPVLQEKINNMTEIERLIPGDKFFRFGFNQSEALVTLVRTPDNTFPIFWRDHKKSGVIYKAPFPRKQ